MPSLKMVRSLFRSIQLLLAAMIGGALSYYLTKFYDTENYGYFLQ